MTETNRSSFGAARIALGFLSVALWGFALWENYFQVPQARRLLGEFDYRVDPLSHSILQYSGLALPILALAGLAVAFWTRSRWGTILVLIGLPLAAGIGLFCLRLFWIHAIMEKLNG